MNINLLKREIEDSGLPMVFISEKSGIPRVTLYNRLNGVGEFTASEIIGLSRVLRFSKAKREAVFFAPDVELEPTTGKEV